MKLTQVLSNSERQFKFYRKRNGDYKIKVSGNVKYEFNTIFTLAAQLTESLLNNGFKVVSSTMFTS